MPSFRKLGPLRKITQILRHSTDMYDQNRVLLECGHETNGNGLRAICSQCALTDSKWRARVVPAIKERADAIRQKIAEDKRKWKTHGNCEAHPCDLCRRLNGLDKIIKGGTQ